MKRKFYNTPFVNIFCFLCFLCWHSSFLSAQDTIKHVDLEDIDIKADKVTIKENASGGDFLTKKHLDNINLYSAGDAAKFLGGVSVRDYGGIGGVKTVSVRGLSSNHTAVLYDGINLLDNQSGQIDLSKYTLSGMSSLSLANAQFSSDLPTAMSLASASGVSIETKKPVLKDKGYDLSSETSLGSFGLFSQTLYFAKSLSLKDIITLTADVTNTQGRYPFKLYYGTGQNFSTRKLKRENNDMFSYHFESNWFHSFTADKSLKIKLFFYDSERGLPSNVALYYNNSKQRLWNRNLFMQSSYTMHNGGNFSYKNNLKFDYNYTRYKDPYYHGFPQGLDDNYTQNFLYMNNAASYRINKRLFVTLTNDLSFNSLDYTIFDAVPQRYSSLTALAVNYRRNNFFVVTDAVHSFYHDDFKDNHRNYNYLSPFVNVGFDYGFYSFSVFYKNIFRMPTFNELYYRRMGNTDLKPEKTNQISLSNRFKAQSGLFALSLDIDVYYNNVIDKIVAIPQNQFLWTMLNYGKVDIKGCDVKFSLIADINPHTHADIKLNYSYQKAVDKDETSYTYGQILPYMPENVFSVVAGFDYYSWHLGYNCITVGKRYSLQENNEQNLLKAYADHGVNISFTSNVKKYYIENIVVTLSCNNIFDKQYEVIRSYPMMGRNFNIKLSINF